MFDYMTWNLFEWVSFAPDIFTNTENVCRCSAGSVQPPYINTLICHHFLWIYCSLLWQHLAASRTSSSISRFLGCPFKDCCCWEQRHHPITQQGLRTTAESLQRTDTDSCLPRQASPGPSTGSISTCISVGGVGPPVCSWSRPEARAFRF